MHWTDKAIILSTRKHGETSAVMKMLCQEHGLSLGVARGANSKKNRGIIQPGNIILATWQARLPEQLGTCKYELLHGYAAHLMPYADKLAALLSVSALIEATLPERHPYPHLYKTYATFIEALASESEWMEAYVQLELTLLAETGFGLDLTECAATGTTEDLIYVSPKSGRAVSRDAGEPYKDKLLPLPLFLSLNAHKKNHVEHQEILAGLRLTGYFLEHWLLEPNHRKIPAARTRLTHALQNSKTVASCA